MAGTGEPGCVSAGSLHTALCGKQVAFTGRLACMSRGEAAKLVRAHGGRYTPTVNERTSLLVVGQEGWPLQKDGRLTNKLQKVEKLQRSGHAVEILQEQNFLGRLGLDPSEEVRRLYSTSQLTNLLNLSRDKLKSWIRSGLIQPVQTVDGLDYFNYAQVVSVKTLADLTQAGVKTEAIRRSLEQLRYWLPDVDEPLAQLDVLDRDGRLLLRVEDALVEPSGQMLLDFDSQKPEPVTLTIPDSSKSAEDWFDLGCQHEDEGRWAQAAEAYRRALLAGGPDRDTSFNLANVLFAMGHKSQAIERYYQALELDKKFADAWVNLGLALTEQNCKLDARTAFEAALLVDPEHAETHYNLADLLEDLGRPEDARQHWQAYLRHDPASDRGRYARLRLAIGNGYN
jgi:tetratricopeptide (TPR) repeat protein